MTASETLLTLPNARPVVLGRERTQVSKMACYRDGVLVAPSAGTLTLKDPAGATVASPTVTIVSSIAQATYSAGNLPSTLAFGEGYTEWWDLTVETVSRPVRRLVTLARFELHPPMTVLDITEGEYPDLEQQLGDYSTTASGDTQLQTFMDKAWDHCMRRLWRMGSPAVLLVDSGDVFDWYRHETLQRVFKALLTMQANERWRELWEYHRDEARAAKDGLRPVQDRDQTGIPDNKGRQAVVMSVHPNTPPRRRRPSGSRRW